MRDIDCPTCAPECHDGGCLKADPKTGRVHHHYCSKHPNPTLHPFHRK